jgi:hypothetical protein
VSMTGLSLYMAQVRLHIHRLVIDSGWLMTGLSLTPVVKRQLVIGFSCLLTGFSLALVIY